MTSFFRRWTLPVVLLILLVVTGARYWSSRHSAPRQPPFIGGDPSEVPPPDAAMRERFEAMLQNLPPEQREAAEERFAADRAFFESVRQLPAEERRQKMQQHFAENPPPPGLLPALPPPGGPMPGGPPPGAGPGGPGADGRSIRIPPPGIRRSMDQQIANSQKNDAQ